MMWCLPAGGPNTQIFHLGFERSATVMEAIFLGYLAAGAFYILSFCVCYSSQKTPDGTEAFSLGTEFIWTFETAAIKETDH